MNGPLVRERNGPFAGKKINRPVAKYDYCHRVCATYVDEKLRVKFEDADGGKSDKAIFDSLRGATGGVGQRKVRYHSRFFLFELGMKPQMWQISFFSLYQTYQNLRITKF